MWEIRQGDALTRLREMLDQSVQTCITSPPYLGLRDYGDDGQIGLEATLGEYVDALVEVFAEVRRVLRDDGTLWLNLGDSYSGSMSNVGIKPKDLYGVPWAVAFALRVDGWFLRSDIVWLKSNPMPESVRDRPTKSHEYVFLLSKTPRYFYDADAISELSVYAGDNRRSRTDNTVAARIGYTGKVNARSEPTAATKNKRSVWTVTTQPYRQAHFATFPPKLIEPMILAGCPLGGVVLDPFAGAATTMMVAERLGRSSIGIELNQEYIDLAYERMLKDWLTRA